MVVTIVFYTFHTGEAIAVSFGLILYISFQGGISQP